MAWTLTVKVRDVNRDPVSASTLFLSVWAGSGNVQNLPPHPITDTAATGNLADNLIHVVIRCQHPYFADCVVALSRTDPSKSWDWSGSASGVSQSNTDVSVVAIMQRLCPAPQNRLTSDQHDDLKSKAAAARASHPQGAFTDLQPSSAIILMQLKDGSDQPQSFPSPAAKNDLHLIKPDPLGDPSKSGWGRFAFTTGNGDPAKAGTFAMLEYGEVSPLVGNAPRFLVCCWIPISVLNSTKSPVDFVIWFTPIVGSKNYPPDKYPFRKAYPYEIWAGGLPNKAFLVQRYIALPWLHLTSSKESGLNLDPTSHHLSYLMAAAGKSAVIVMPICPAILPGARPPQPAYEAFMSQAGLMRLLKELCMQVALFRQNKPAQYAPPPEVGKIAVAGLSAGMQHCQMVIKISSPLSPYTDSHWRSDDGEFRKNWTEFWSFDASYESIKDRTGKVIAKGDDLFRTFLNDTALWVQQGDRHLRLYKTDYTVAGKWDPRKESSGAFARMVKRAAPLRVQSSASPWALSVSSPDLRWQCISLSEEYMQDPDCSTGIPEIPVGWDQYHKTHPKEKKGEYGNLYHNAVPRMFFGHALLTSSFT